MCNSYKRTCSCKTYPSLRLFLQQGGKSTVAGEGALSGQERSKEKVYSSNDQHWIEKSKGCILFMMHKANSGEAAFPLFAIAVRITSEQRTQKNSISSGSDECDPGPCLVFTSKDHEVSIIRES